MSNRRILIIPHVNPDNAIFWGICTAKTVNAYWGAASGTANIFYKDNGDGTWTYYMINPNHAKQWWDRFAWYNSSAVKTFHVNPKLKISSTRNNTFGAKAIEVYDFGTAKVTPNSMYECFYQCFNLETLDISNWNLANCTTFYAMIAQNINISDITDASVSKLHTVNMPNTISGPCTSTQKMFAWNRGVETITGMKTVDFSKVKTFSEMFCECYKLANVDFNITNWVSSVATNLSSMFLSCKELDLSQLGDFTTWDVSNITNFSYCFGKTKTTTFDLSGWDMSKAQKIDGMFQVNYQLTSINLSNSTLNTEATHTNLLMGCPLLETIDLRGSTGWLDVLKEQLVKDKMTQVKLITDEGTLIYTNNEWIS